MSPDSTQRDFDIGPQNEPPPSRRKKLLWAAGAIAVVLVLGLVVHSRIASHGGGGAFRPGGRGRFAGPLAVGVAQATTGDVPITIDSLGTVTPLATVTVHPQVTGPLVKINFNEGQLVKAGDLLAQIDPRPFQAAVDQAQGQLQHDQALLANARVDLERYKTLMAQNSVAEQTYATQQATVLQDEATVVSDTAALETAKLNLSYCRITSPVAGSVGLRQVDNGNVVSAYSSSIVVVTQLQPMSVLFTVPEDNLEEVLQRLHRGDKLSVLAFDRTFTTQLDGGVLSNSDNEVDTTTGTLKLRAMFNNSTLQLFPDQFVNVRLTLDTLHNQVLVPGSAVQNGATGNYVYTVDRPTPQDDAAFDPPPNGQVAAARPGGGKDRGSGRRGGRDFALGAAAGPVRIAHVRYVKTGPSVGNMVSIQQGVQPGETVVVDGAEQLRDGAPVTVPNDDAAGSGAADAGPGDSVAAAQSPAPSAGSGNAAQTGRPAATGYGAYGGQRVRGGRRGAVVSPGGSGQGGQYSPSGGGAGGAPAGSPAGAATAQ